MKRVLFFIQDGWAFGSIHQALCKELYKYGIYANIFDWNKQSSHKEWKMLDDIYDTFVTLPLSVNNLHDGYGVPLEKIIAIAHGQWDLLVAKQQGLDFIQKLKKFAVVSKILNQKSIEFGYITTPEVVTLGIHFDLFYQKISSSLKNVGYAGAKQAYNFAGVEIKRGQLVEELISNIDNINLIEHENYNHLCMPSYYKKIDSLIMSSIEEGAGLPVMEAAAAGRLVIGTPVGYFEHNSILGAGISVPLSPSKFIEETREHLLYYRDNPQAYREKCQSIQQFARDNYDWSVVIDQWVNLLNS